MTTEVVNGGGAPVHLEQYVVAPAPIVTLSREQYVANGVQVQFTISFPYISRTHVVVLINGVPISFPQWDFITDTLIQLGSAPTAGVVVELRRSTPLAPLVTYTDGAVLTAADLNLATLQNLYLLQEFNDLYMAALNGGLTQVAGYNGPVAVSPAELIAAVSDQVLSNALTVTLQQRINDIDLNANALLAQSTVIDGINNIIDGLTGSSGIGVALTTETNSRITGDSALQTQLTLLGAFNGPSQTAFVINQSTAYIDPTTSFATYTSNITSQFLSVNAAVNTESTARASGDSANASLITALTATVAANAAIVTTETNARVSGDTSLASQITTLTATVSGNTSAISTETTARITGDSANASAITTLNTTVSGNSASISTQATSINGLSAQYTVKVDVNGRVSGYGLASTATTAGASSAFIVVANEFAVVDPGSTGSTPVVPFTITGGVCYMQSVVINDALIGSLTVNKLTAGSLSAVVVQNADWNAGTGRIVWDNGTYMKVVGVGFGSANQFIEWYGPHQAAFTSCTEQNAYAYQKTNGATFSLGISSPGGLIKQSVSTPSTVTGGVVVQNALPALATYPMISNGRTITVTAQVSSQQVTGTCNTAPAANGTMTYTLYRTIGGAAETIVQTNTVSLTPTITGPSPYTVQFNGTITTYTYTDTSATPQNHSYRLGVAWTPPAGWSAITWTGAGPYLGAAILTQSEPDH